ETPSLVESGAQEKILKLFAAKPRGRLTPAEIQRRAGFHPNELPSVVDALRELCRNGRLVRLKKNHYALPDRQNLVNGRVQAHPDGYGFLIPDDKDAEDLYLNRREMRRVMHGDRVMARIDRKARGGTEVHIVQVLERAHKRLLGTYDELSGKAYLVPMDPRVAAIPLKLTGTKPEQGKVVAAEIFRYATAMSAPEAAVVKIMGDPDDPEVQVQSLVFRYGLSATFPPEVFRETKDLAFSTSPDEIS